MTEVYNLDRETNIKNNVDALGKKWEVHQERGRALYHARPNPDRSDAVIPKNMQGSWTKVELLQAEILKYLHQTWNKAEQVKAKNDKRSASK
jgi:hypothetical protein